jgi:hypothetical protein
MEEQNARLDLAESVDARSKKMVSLRYKYIITAICKCENSQEIASNMASIVLTWPMKTIIPKSRARIRRVTTTNMPIMCANTVMKKSVKLSVTIWRMEI